MISSVLSIPFISFWDVFYYAMKRVHHKQSGPRKESHRPSSPDQKRHWNNHRQKRNHKNKNGYLRHVASQLGTSRQTIQQIHRKQHKSFKLHISLVAYKFDAQAHTSMHSIFEQSTFRIKHLRNFSRQERTLNNSFAEKPVTPSL